MGNDPIIVGLAALSHTIKGAPWLPLAAVNPGAVDRAERSVDGLDLPAWGTDHLPRGMPFHSFLAGWIRAVQAARGHCSISALEVERANPPPVKSMSARKSGQGHSGRPALIARLPSELPGAREANGPAHEPCRCWLTVSYTPKSTA